MNGIKCNKRIDFVSSCIHILKNIVQWGEDSLYATLSQFLCIVMVRVNSMINFKYLINIYQDMYTLVANELYEICIFT